VPAVPGLAAVPRLTAVPGQAPGPTARAPGTGTTARIVPVVVTCEAPAPGRAR